MLSSHSFFLKEVEITIEWRTVVSEPEKKSFVKACQEFFSGGKYGKKVEIAEFKMLSTQDKIDLSQMLLAAGFDHKPYTGEGVVA